jgi:hypothetical protein
MKVKNGAYWAYYIRRVFIPGLQFYQRVVTEKFLPSLSEESIGSEADRVQEEVLELLKRSVEPEESDPSHYDKMAFDEGLEFYQLMHDTRQGLINSFTAGLYHLFEQQICELYRLIAWDKQAVLNGEKAIKNLQMLGLNARDFPEWTSLEEVRLLANCIKHAEGSSCKLLAERRPDLFEQPTIGPKLHGPRAFVERPLSGDGIYVSASEFERMADTAKRFWEYVIKEIS